jgi:hypothetical protein
MILMKNTVLYYKKNMNSVLIKTMGLATTPLCSLTNADFSSSLPRLKPQGRKSDPDGFAFQPALRADGIRGEVACDHPSLTCMVFDRMVHQ